MDATSCCSRILYKFILAIWIWQFNFRSQLPTNHWSYACQGSHAGHFLAEFYDGILQPQYRQEAWPLKKPFQGLKHVEQNERPIDFGCSYCMHYLSSECFEIWIFFSPEQYKIRSFLRLATWTCFKNCWPPLLYHHLTIVFIGENMRLKHGEFGAFPWSQSHFCRSLISSAGERPDGWPPALPHQKA